MTLLLRNTMGKTASQGIRSLVTNRIIGIKADNMKPSSFIAHDMVIRWGCTKSLPVPLPMEKQVNTPEAIRRVSGKAGFRRILLTANPSLIPATWFEFNETIQLPVVVRPQHHEKGQNFYTIGDTLGVWAIQQAMTQCGPGAYISAYIPKVQEFRVFVVQGRATCVMEKNPVDRSATVWNCDHGNMTVVHWNNWHLQAVRKSIEAFNLSGLDFGAVDVIVDNRGTAYVLEINTAPGLKFNDDGTPSYTMQCMAKAFDYIITNRSKAPIPLVAEKGGYKKFIHPAICEQALLVRGT